MKKYLGLALLLSLVVLLPVHAAPGDDAKEQQPELTWYDVEIIIFRHHDLVGASKENWPLNPGEPDFSNATRLLPALPYRLSSAQTARLRKLAFTRLRPDEMRMDEQLADLVKAKGYEPLLHIAWRQPGYERDDAKAVQINGGVPITLADLEQSGDDGTPEEPLYYNKNMEGPPPPIINGTITLSRSRFLHIDADLVYHNVLPEQKGDIVLPTRYFRMQASRRMRSTEVNYIDHPMFGMLVLITPYESPEQKKDDTEAKP